MDGGLHKNGHGCEIAHSGQVQRLRTCFEIQEGLYQPLLFFSGEINVDKVFFVDLELGLIGVLREGFYCVVSVNDFILHFPMGAAFTGVGNMALFYT